MIHINKNTANPTALKTVQDEIEDRLLEQESRFKWQTEHYSRPIKEDLKNLYHNKCGFCEVKLTENDTPQKFTVEHFRPKSIYWWLGNEWTNLFPTCKKCNDNKEDDFDLRYGKKFRVTEPTLTSVGTLDRNKCLASEYEFINEQAYFLHPEIDKPEHFFEFLPNGRIKVKVNDALSDWDKSRAQKMIDKFLGVPSIEEKRLKYINNLRRDLERHIDSFFKIVDDGNPTKREIRLGFNSFFEKLFKTNAFESEFSQLGYWMTESFSEFFLESELFSEDIKNLILYAMELFLEDNL